MQARLSTFLSRVYIYWLGDARECWRGTDHEDPWQFGVGLGYRGTGEDGGRICLIGMMMDVDVDPLLTPGVRPLFVGLV